MNEYAKVTLIIELRDGRSQKTVLSSAAGSTIWLRWTPELTQVPNLGTGNIEEKPTGYVTVEIYGKPLQTGLIA